MGVVLVVEPDAAQAELLLRVLRKRVRAEAILVTSTTAAIEQIDRGTPALILVSALLAPRDEDRLMAHLRSLEDADHLQTLTIPRLAVPGPKSAETSTLGRFRKKKAAAPVRAGCDPELFAQEISAQLARAAEIQKHPAARRIRVVQEPVVSSDELETVEPPPVFSEQSHGEPAPDFSSVWLEADPPDNVVTVVNVVTVDTVDTVDAAVEPEPELEPVTVLAAVEVTEDADDQLARLALRFGLEVEPAESGAAGATGASGALDAAPHLSQQVPVHVAVHEVAVSEAPDDYLARLARRFGFGAAAHVDATPSIPEPPPVEIQAVLDVPEAPDDRLARLARRFGFDSFERSVHLQVDPPLPPADPTDLQAEIDKADSAERLAAHVAAVEAEATLAAELERVRAEGEARRLSELARLQAEADIVRDAAIVETRAAAEREAREALASELTRVRSEAEGVFAADLARVRAEVEEKLSAQVEAAETRLAVAEQARNAAEAAAAAALEAEVARVRVEAETRLQSELERIRTEAEAARMAELSHAKHATQQIREAAAREARDARASAEAAAQQTLDAEMARVRAQADSFLQAEVARVRAEAQEHKAVELQELRAQMAEIRDTAARTAAEQSVDYYKIWQPPPVGVEVPQPASAAVVEATPAPPERHIPWVKWALPTAACLLVMVNNGAVIDTFASFIGPSPRRTPPPAHVVEPVAPQFVKEKTTGALKVASTPTGARLLVDGRSYGATPLTIPSLEAGVHTLVLRTGAGSVTRRVTVKAGQTAVASEAIFSGWLAVYSSLPMTISLNGKPASAGAEGRILTPPGSYEVSLVNDRFNYHGTKTLEVRPGEVTAYTVSLPSATVRFVAPEGAEITVDGESAGKTPHTDVSMPIGTHEITATLPDAGKRTATIAVRYGEITEARFDFTR